MGRLIVFKNKPSIISSYTVCGPKEAEGCLAGYIDLKIYDDYDNQPSFELAEGAIKGARESLFGAVTGGMKAASAGISAAVVFSFFNALIFRPSSKIN